MYGHSAKQLQNALTSQISVAKDSMSLEACKLLLLLIHTSTYQKKEACKLNENSSNMFVCFQIRHRS